MKDTKIIQVLRTFSPQQIKEFGYFVRSPFYNRVKNVSALFDAIRKFYPEFNSRFLNKEYLYKRITGKKDYNDNVMRNLSSDLYKLAEEYLTVKSLKRKKDYGKMVLLTELQKSLPEKNLLLEFEKLMNSIEHSRYKDEEYYFNSFQLWNLRNNNFNHKNVEIFQKNISAEISELAQYFIIHLFDRYFHVNRFRASYKTRVRHSFLSDTAKVLKKYGYMESPVVQIYYDMFTILVTMDEKHYFHLKELLIDNFKVLTSYNKLNLFQSLSSFFLHCERSGVTKFRRDRFELYRDYAASGDLIYNNELDDGAYTSAVTSAVIIGEYEWAEKFTEDYKKYLLQNLRQDAYYYNRARILHAKKRNEEALEYLARIIPTNHTVKTVVKVVELQILFELKAYDSIYHKLDSFRHFITKNEEMSANMRESLRNFFKTYSMLVEIKSGNKKYTPVQIKKETSTRKYSYSMEWLSEKIEELKAHK